MKTMKHMSKRALSLFLALTMCLGMLNLTVFAAEDEEGLVYTCGLEEHVHTEACYKLVCTKGDDSEEAETEPGEPEDTDDQDAVADDEESKDDESEDNDSEEAETKPGESEDADTTDDESEDNDSEEAETKPGESEDADTTDDESEDNDSEEAETKPSESEDADTTDDESEDNDSEEAETEPGEPEDADTTDDESEGVDSQDTDSESTDSQETDSQDTASEADESNQSGTDAVSDSSTSTAPEPASSSTEQIEDTEMLASLGFLVLYGSVSDTEDEADEPDVHESSEPHVHTEYCYELVCGKEEHIHDETCTAPKVTIAPNLQSLSLTNNDSVTLKLLEAPYVTVTKVNISEVQLEVSVTRQLSGQSETVTLGEGSTLTVTYQDVNATYEVNYTAYDGEKQELARAQATFSVADYNRIPDKMEGDEAYISSAGLTSHEKGYNGQYLLTGTEPFDTEPSGNGYDQDQGDLYVRTYDTVTYQVTYSTQMQNDAQTTNVGSGRVCYELVLPVDATKATFDLGGSAWIKTNAEAAYKQETIDGKQVIRGSFLMQAGSEGGAAIGSSYQTLTIGIRVLNMKNGQTLQPEFTFWLEGNQVAENYQYETVYANNGTQVNIPSGPLVTGNGYVCPSHDHQEFQTVKPEAVIISARPMYNLRIQGSGAEDLGSYNFDTGNDKAPNKDAGTRYGYLMNYALTLELDGQQNRGLRGMELLDGSPITFDIQLSGSRNVPAVDTPDFAPLYWSMDGMNNNRTKQDGRYISATNAVPYGRAPFNTGNSTNACYNGGTWTFVQDVSDPDIVHVTVSGYQIDLTHLPCNYFGDTPGNYSVYNPTELGDAYWNLEGKAIFATGEVWVVQPMNTGTNGANGTSMGDAAKVDVNVTVSLESSDKEHLIIGNAQYPQMCDTDQVAQTTFSTVPSGNVDNRIYYMSIPSGDWEPLTPGQLTGDGDWARIGMPVEIRADLTYDNHLGLDQGAAYDMMIKFDDEFFEPTGGVRYSMPGGFIHGWESTYNSVKTFWATKAGGWSNDEEMKATGADSTSLTWYPTLEAAKASGTPIVASLTEFRGLTKELTSHMHVFIQGKVKDTAEPGNVYMVTHDSYVWSIGNLGLTGRDDITLEQINAKLPSQGNNRTSYSDYPQCAWRGTGTDDGGPNGAIPTYEKATYDENGLFTSHGTSSYGGDSCLVLAYTTEITNVVAQTMIEGGKTVEKTTFSLDNGERVVDFKATPSIVLEEVSHSSSGTGTPSENLETVTVTVTLPKGLTYIAGSSYWGGNYAQDPTWKNKGTVSGGIQLEEPTSVIVPVFNAEGKQTGTATALQWTLEKVNVNQGGSLAPIYYSCTIGTPDNFSTDVKNGDNLNVTMRVQSDTDKRPTLESNENLKDYSIKVTREEGANVVKTTQTPVVETGTSANFIYDMQVTNSNNNPISNAVVVECLPYQGEGSQSNFKGTLTLTGFTWNVNGKASKDLTFYYTKDEKFKGASSASVDAKAVQDWTPLTAGNSLNLANVTAIAAVGTLPKQAVLNMTVTLSLSNPKPGEYLVNTISCNSLNSSETMSDSARSAVASRRLEGLTWLDANQNGRQDSGEARLPGVTVELYQWVDGTYKLFTVDGKPARIVTGQQMDVSTGKVDDYGTDAEARYLFTNLPEGTFAVRFSSTEGRTEGPVDLSRYAATTPDAPNVDDQYDSDGVPAYDENGLLTETWIKDINMPDINGIPTGGVYESKYHDSGFYGGNLTIAKKIVDDEEYPSDAAKSETIVVELKAANSETINLLDGEYPYEQTIGKTTTTGTVTFNSKGIAKLDGTTNWKFTGDASLVIHGLPVGAEFTVMEYDDADGTNSRIDGYDLTVEISGNVGHAGNKSHKFTGVAIVLNDDKKIVDPSVTITNTYKRTAGSLTITKTVSGLADANAINKTYTFTVEAVGDTLKKDVSEKSFGELTFDAYGKATVTIEVYGNDSESKTFTGLLTGQYTVTENSETAKIPYYVLDVQSEQTLDVKADEKAEFKYTNAYSPSDKNAQLTITKAVSADDNQLSASTTPYTFLVNGTDVYGNAVSERVVVNGSGATQTVLPKGTYTITEATPADVIPGYTWNSVSFQSANRVTVNGAAVTVNLTGEGTVEAAFTATNHYTRDTSSLTIAKEVAGTVSAESVAEKVFKFEVTGPVDANGTYSGVTFENGKAVVEITGASRVTIENLPTGAYTVEEDLDSARVSGRTLSSVTYTDSDEGDDAIPNDGTVTLVKNTDNHVTVVNTYRTPSSPSPDPTPDPRPVPDPDPDPEPRPDPTPDPDPEPEPDDPNVEIPDEDTPLADQPGPDSDVNIPEEEVPLVEIPEEEVPLMEIPDEEVPLANVPKTGDGSGLWYVMALLSGCGLAVLNLLKKREK